MTLDKFIKRYSVACLKCGGNAIEILSDVGMTPSILCKKCCFQED